MIIRKAFEKVVRGKQYSIYASYEHGSVMKKNKTVAKEMPKEAMKFLEKTKKGGSLQFSLALVKELREVGVESYLAFTFMTDPDRIKRETYAVVCYKIEGEFFIADPTASVRSIFYGGMLYYFDLPLSEFMEDYGSLILLYDPYGEYGKELFFGDFLNHPMEIVGGNKLKAV